MGICVRLLPYAHGQHINVLRYVIRLRWMLEAVVEVAVSRNRGLITLFDSTSDPEPQNLGQVVWI